MKTRLIRTSHDVVGVRIPYRLVVRPFITNNNYSEVRYKKEVLTLFSDRSNTNTIKRYLGMYTTALFSLFFIL